MTNDDFREMLSVLREGRNKEFKSTMPWDNKEIKCKIVKSILAFSNVRDGGYLIIGVEQLPDGTFNPNGMTDSDYQTYNEDDLCAFVAEYADPFVQIELHPMVIDDKRFIAIKVQEFSEIPVICKKDGPSNLVRGQVYTRTYRMPETAVIPTQSEMRELLDLAVEKQVRNFFQRQTRAGITVEMITTDSLKFAKQRQEFDA
jgi:predicted HTH transcriptional regulator